MDNTVVVQDSTGAWLPLDLKESPVLVKQINTFEDFEDRQATYSQELVLPCTPNNRRVLGFAADKQLGGSQEQRYRSYPVRCYMNGVDVLGSGYILYLLGTNQDGDYSSQIISERTAFFDEIDSNDLEFYFGNNRIVYDNENTYLYCLDQNGLFTYLLPDPLETHKEVKDDGTPGNEFTFSTVKGFYGNFDTISSWNRNDVFVSNLVLCLNWRRAIEELINKLPGWTLNAPFLDTAEDFFITCNTEKFYSTKSQSEGSYNFMGGFAGGIIHVDNPSAFPELLYSTRGTCPFNFSTKTLTIGNISGFIYTIPPGQVNYRQSEFGFINSSAKTMVYYDEGDLNLKIIVPQNCKINFFSSCTVTTSSVDDTYYYYNIIVYRYKMGTTGREVVSSNSYGSYRVRQSESSPYNTLTFDAEAGDLYEIYAYSEVKIESFWSSIPLRDTQLELQYGLGADSSDLPLFGQSYFLPKDIIPFENPSDILREYIKALGLFANIDTENKVLTLSKLSEVLVDNVENGNAIDFSNRYDVSLTSEDFSVEGFLEKNYIEFGEISNDNGDYQDLVSLDSNGSEKGEQTVLTLDFNSCQPFDLITGSNVNGGETITAGCVPIATVPALSEYTVDLAAGQYQLFDVYGIRQQGTPDKFLLRRGKLLGDINVNVSSRYYYQCGQNSISTGISSIYAPFNVETYTVYTGSPVSAQYLKDSFFSEFESKVLTNPLSLSVRCFLRPSDYVRIDLYAPVYIREYGKYFYIKRINNFDGSNLTEVQLIKL